MPLSHSSGYIESPEGSLSRTKKRLQKISHTKKEKTVILWDEFRENTLNFLTTFESFIFCKKKITQLQSTFNHCTNAVLSVLL